MPDPIKQALSELAPVQGRLNELDTRLSTAIHDIEVRIRDHVSTRIAIAVRLPNSNEATLAFGKHDGKWCLALELGGQRVPLLSAPREIRAAVFAGGHIEELIRAASGQLKQQIAERETAVRAAHDLVVAMGAQPSKERRRG